MSLRDYFSNNKIFTGTEKPTQGKFDVGDIIVNIGPNSAEEPMWICVEAGTPGVWELCSGVNEEEITNLIQSNALTAVEYTDGVDIQIDGGEIGNMNELQTTDKSSIVGAINELFQSANNGKELIASVIGEPVSAEDTFSAMSNDINSLLSTFKTNMMNAGVVVESEDKFKALIDKIQGLTEGEGNKGVQYAEGTCSLTHTIDSSVDHNLVTDLAFTPTIAFVTFEGGRCFVGSFSEVATISNYYFDESNPFVFVFEPMNQFELNTYMKIIDNGVQLHISTNLGYSNQNGIFNVKWYAIGVGEEDTTLRDSLASILQEEGVDVTEEDDMASLIVKVDTEFESKSYIQSIVNGTDSQTPSTFIKKSDGSLWACGLNGYGQLGLGDTSTKLEFMQVTTNINNDVKQVSSGCVHAYVLKNDGSLWAAGRNYCGQLGLGVTGDTYNKTVFTQVTTNVNNDVKQVICGSHHTYIIKNDGSLWACGLNGYGQLGLGDTTNRNTFTQVTTNVNNDVKHIQFAITPGENSYNCTFIIKNDETVWVAGRYNSVNYTTFTQIL